MVKLSTGELVVVVVVIPCDGGGGVAGLGTGTGTGTGTTAGGCVVLAVVGSERRPFPQFNKVIASGLHNPSLPPHTFKHLLTFELPTVVLENIHL